VEDVDGEAVENEDFAIQEDVLMNHFPALVEGGGHG